jgi:hypothetical protein
LMKEESRIDKRTFCYFKCESRYDKKKMYYGFILIINQDFFIGKLDLAAELLF